MICVTRNVAPGRPIDCDARVDFVEIAVPAAFQPKSFLGTYARTSVFSDFFALPDRPYGKQAKAGDGTANTERSLGHCSNGI